MATNGVNSSPSSMKDDTGQTCIPNIIAGKPIVLPSSTSFPIVSTQTQSILHYGQTASIPVAQQAVDAAAATFKTYKCTPVHERRNMLLRAVDLFDAKVEEAMLRQTRETSCSEDWGRFIAGQTSMFLREVAGAITSAVSGELPPSAFGNTALVFKEPVGPVLIIPPWNAAIVLCARGVANALAAGCAVFLKASELCLWTHQFVVEVFHEAGFPPGAVNFYYG